MSEYEHCVCDDEECTCPELFAEMVQEMRGPVVSVEPERLSSPYECLAAE